MHLFGEVEHGQAYETVRCSMLTQLRNMFLHPFRPGPHRGPTTSTRAFRQVENLIRSDFYGLQRPSALRERVDGD